MYTYIHTYIHTHIHTYRHIHNINTITVHTYNLISIYYLLPGQTFKIALHNPLIRYTVLSKLLTELH